MKSSIKVKPVGLTTGNETLSRLTSPTHGMGTEECLTLIKHLTAKEDLNHEEEDLFGNLEVELTADLVAEEFSGEVGRLIDFQTAESVVLLESFADWSSHLKDGKEVSIG